MHYDCAPWRALMRVVRTLTMQSNTRPLLPFDLVAVNNNIIRIYLNNENHQNYGFICKNLSCAIYEIQNLLIRVYVNPRSSLIRKTRVDSAVGSINLLFWSFNENMFYFLIIFFFFLHL